MFSGQKRKKKESKRVFKVDPEATVRLFHDMIIFFVGMMLCLVFPEPIPGFGLQMGTGLKECFDWFRSDGSYCNKDSVQ